MGHQKMHEWITTGERPLPFFVTPFAKSATGGKGDDDDDDSDDDGDDDSDDDEDDDPDEDKTDAELRAELKSTRASLEKANGQSAKRRRTLREREAELIEARKPKKVTKKDGDADDAPDLDALRHEARSEGEKVGTTRAKRAEAKSALLYAGVNPARVARAVGLLDLEELDLDDDGLDGVDDAIESLRTEWPELFAKKRTRRESVAGDNDRNGDGQGRKNASLTPSQRQAALVTGGR